MLVRLQRNLMSALSLTERGSFMSPHANLKQIQLLHLQSLQIFLLAIWRLRFDLLVDSQNYAHSATTETILPVLLGRWYC